MMMMLLCFLFIHVEGMRVKTGVLTLLLEVIIRIRAETIMNFRFICLDLDLVLYDLNFRWFKAPRIMSLGWILIFVFLYLFSLFFYFFYLTFFIILSFRPWLYINFTWFLNLYFILFCIITNY